MEVINLEVTDFTKGNTIALWQNGWGNIILKDADMTVV